MFCSARRCSHTVLQLPPEENKHTETMSPFIIPLPFPHQPSFLILLTPFSNHSLLTSFSSILHLFPLLRFAHFSSFLFLPNQKPASQFFASLFPPFPLLPGHCDNLIRGPVAAALAASKVRESQKHTRTHGHTRMHVCVCMCACVCVRVLTGCQLACGAASCPNEVIPRAPLTNLSPY